MPCMLMQRSGLHFTNWCLASLITLWPTLGQVGQTSTGVVHRLAIWSEKFAEYAGILQSRNQELSQLACLYENDQGPFFKRTIPIQCTTYRPNHNFNWFNWPYSNLPGLDRFCGLILHTTGTERPGQSRVLNGTMQKMTCVSDLLRLLWPHKQANISWTV